MHSFNGFCTNLWQRMSLENTSIFFVIYLSIMWLLIAFAVCAVLFWVIELGVYRLLPLLILYGLIVFLMLYVSVKQLFVRRR